MPWLLYRYILGELLRTIALTTGVLVTVIAFGASIKPLASGLLAPTDIARYVAFAIVPMLQFALPFAAGFGATIVLHRLTTDNEVQACAVGGISYRRLLVPIVGLGAVLTVLLLVLVHGVIPRFWVMMNRVVAQDAARVFQTSIERGRAFKLGDFMIFSDAPESLRAPVDTGAETRLVLSRVAAADLDAEGNIVTEVTAGEAVIDFHRLGAQTYLKLVLRDAVVFDRRSGRLVTFPELIPDGAILVPPAFTGGPKFMSLAGLLELRDDPDRYPPVAEARDALAAAMQRNAVREHLSEKINGEGQLVLVTPDGRRCTIRADRLRQEVLYMKDGSDVVVEEWEGGGLRRRITCARADIEMLEAGHLGAAVFNLTMNQCTVYNPQFGSEPHPQEREALRGLAMMQELETELFGLSSGALKTRAQPVAERSSSVARALERLDHQIDTLHRRARAQIAQRGALSATGILLLTLGAVLAMKLRHSLPLVIYVLAFLPSIGDLLLISGGEQMVRDNQTLGGYAVMWSGNALLAVMIVVTYLRLARN